ncbi:cytochrome P450 [Bradyrhizobium genosp. P]|uniref:cytochrome P450 n=1 Tax=Bradyrhizobium genosp. P TaxID=83641 RepID=UPI003CEE4D91
MNLAQISPDSARWSMLLLADENPFPAYEELRKRGEVVWDPGMNCWLVLSHGVCKTIESDEATYRILRIDALPLAFEIFGDNPQNPVQIGSVVGGEHARMRRLYLKLLGPALMPQYRVEHVLPVISHLIDRFAERGSAELASELAYELSNRVMGSLFGLRWKDQELMAEIDRWHKDFSACAGRGYLDEGTNRKGKLASAELNNLYRPLVAERREKRGIDFISQIWTLAQEEYGQDIPEDHILAFVRDIEIGAADTTSNAIANAIYLFLSDPAMRKAVSEDQEATLNLFVEETLRLFGSVQWRFRKANRDVCIGGAEIKKDDVICVLHAAANRDPEHYACPHMMDLKRKPPTDHLAFNVGPRICLGMHLARLMIRETLKALITRFPNLRLDQSREPPRFRAFSHRSFAPLHVKF